MAVVRLNVNKDMLKNDSRMFKFKQRYAHKWHLYVKM